MNLKLALLLLLAMLATTGRVLKLNTFELSKPSELKIQPTELITSVNGRLQLNYIERKNKDGSFAKRQAYPSESYFPTNIPFQTGTADPKWYVINLDNKNADPGPYDDLTYLGQDGKVYKAHVHAHWNASRIDIWLSNVTEDGKEKHDDSSNIVMIDWNGKPHRVVFSDHIENHRTPSFGYGTL